MTKDEIIKAYEQLSAEDQQAVRTKIAGDTASSGCCGDDMKKHC